MSGALGPPPVLHDPAAVRRLILDSLTDLPVRDVPLGEAGGLVLAAPLVARFALPGFTNAAMDGYALRAGDTLAAPVRLVIGGRSLAGAPLGRPLGPREAVAIATGAMVPVGADTVLCLEDAVVEGEHLLVGGALAAGRHIRMAGEDAAVGTVMVEAGTILGPGQVACAAALGLLGVPVHPRPRVAIVPTGDEIVPGGQPLGPGLVYDAVGPAVADLVREAGGEPVVLAPVKDDEAALMEALERAAAGADAVVTIGGVAVGERDLLARLPLPVQVRSFRLALRPARPFGYGTAFGKPLFALPGNPGSALAAFEELARPAVLRLLGKAPAARASATASLAEPVVQTPGSLHLVRATVWREDGALRARPAGPQGAAMILTLARANAWMVIPAGSATLPEGSQVDVRLLTDPDAASSSARAHI